LFISSHLLPPWAAICRPGGLYERTSEALQDSEEGAKWVDKYRRFNRLQGALDKLMKTKGATQKDVKNEGSSG
jgi:hypothetical protein